MPAPLVAVVIVVPHQSVKPRTEPTPDPPSSKWVRDSTCPQAERSQPDRARMHWFVDTSAAATGCTHRQSDPHSGHSRIERRHRSPNHRRYSLLIRTKDVI